MEEFTIKGSNGFFRIQIDRVHGFPDSMSYFGGYDTESIIEIKCSNYYVKGLIWITTGIIHDFFLELKKCHEEVKGQANLSSNEYNLEAVLSYDIQGHVFLRGSFKEDHIQRNVLEFKLESDQSFLSETIAQLKFITSKYGH